MDNRRRRYRELFSLKNIVWALAVLTMFSGRKLEAEIIGNVASTSCTARVSELLGALRTYWAIPASAAFHRIDVAIPFLLHQDAFRGLGSGEQTLSYSISSNYYADGSDIKVSVSSTYPFTSTADPSSLSLTLLSTTLSGTVAATGTFTASSCTAGTKWKTKNNLGLVFLRSTAGNALVISDISSLCTDPTATMLSKISAAAPRSASTAFVSGVATYCWTGDSNCAATKADMNAITSSATLANFCALFQNE